MKKLVYCVEVGVVLDKNDCEFDCYTIGDFFDDCYGFYDENRVLTFDYQHAIDYAKDYVKNGVINTYAIIHSDIFNFDKKDIEDIENWGYADDYIFSPTIESTSLLLLKNESNRIEKIISKRR